MPMAGRTAISPHASAQAALTGMSTWLRPEPGVQVVTPLVRALGVVSAFAPHERWLGNGQLAQRTGLPPSTITRIAQSLVKLGYLLYDSQDRKYRLLPTVLGLGYAAIAHSAIQGLGGEHMATFADQHEVHVCLAARDRLDLVVLECRRSAACTFVLPMHVGMRLGIARSPMGWALLGGLPEMERCYLLENVERRMSGDWMRLRHRLHEGTAQVDEKGYCAAIGEWEADIGTLAVPVLLEGNAPFVLACIGPSRGMTRARLERVLGPKLMAMARTLQTEFNELSH